MSRFSAPCKGKELRSGVSPQPGAQGDAEAYKGRNVVERSFNKAKQWRGLATRYDKLAITYRAADVIFTILTWLRT